MLATRIIPTLLQRGSTLVKGKQFDSWRSVGHALQAVKIHQARGVDELVYLDIAATPEGRGPNFRMVEQLTRECFVPITVGGGVRSAEDVTGLLHAGADKVAICSKALQDTEIISKLAGKFGSQAITVAIDYCMMQSSRWDVNRACVTARAGKDAFTVDEDRTEPLTPIQWAVECEEAGAGEILLTCIDRDGVMEGYDLEILRKVSEAVSIPVIASGGCKDYEDMYNAIQAGASAVAAGALFQFTDCTPRGAAEYLKEKGVEVRL